MTAPKPIRAFLALELNDTVRSNLEKAVAPLRETGAHVSWVPADNLHLSLAFLGNIFPDTVDLVSTALDELAESSSRFSFEVMNLGAFGSKRSPRVIWAGIAHNPELVSLHGRLMDLLGALDLSLDSRGFKPHITLGRVRSSRGRDSLVEALNSAKPTQFGRANATRVALMQSTLTPRRAVYSIVHAPEFTG